jgi:hypothetical protein
MSTLATMPSGQVHARLLLRFDFDFDRPLHLHVETLAAVKGSAVRGNDKTMRSFGQGLFEWIEILPLVLPHTAVGQRVFLLIAVDVDVGQFKIDKTKKTVLFDLPVAIEQFGAEIVDIPRAAISGHTLDFELQVGNHHQAVVGVHLGVDTPGSGLRILDRYQVVALIAAPARSARFLRADRGTVRRNQDSWLAIGLAKDQQRHFTDTGIDREGLAGQGHGIGFTGALEHPVKNFLKFAGRLRDRERTAGFECQLFQQHFVGTVGQGDGMHLGSRLFQRGQAFPQHLVS